MLSYIHTKDEIELSMTNEMNRLSTKKIIS